MDASQSAGFGFWCYNSLIMLESIFGFFIAIFILVVIHELGHFLFAKWTGCRVDEFAVGFKPALFQKKWRGTNYVLGSIPVGGYVKIWGENGSEEVEGDPNNPQAFYNRPRWAQALVLLAGVLCNVILAWLCFSLLLTRGLEVSSTQFPSHELSNPHVQVVHVLEGSSADEAGIVVGDRIVGWGDSPDTIIESTNRNDQELRDFIAQHGEAGMVLVLESQPTEEEHVVYVSSSLQGGQMLVGVGLDTLGTLRLPVHESLYHGARMAWDFSVTTVWFISHFVSDLFVGQADTSMVSGPVGIAQFAGDSFTQGFDEFVWFIAVLSLNLAIFNLLPIPALDGGRLVCVAVEAIIRRPMSPQWFMWINAGGFIFLIGLMVLVTALDISRFFGA